MAFCFFIQAEDGIRDLTVTGVQTCALPIYGHIRSHVRYARPRIDACERRARRGCAGREKLWDIAVGFVVKAKIVRISKEIGRASCRGKRVDIGGRRIIKKKKNK